MSVYDRIRHPAARTVAEEPATGTLDDLRGRSYCVLVSYRRSGEPVPTPVWFGVSAGKVYVQTEADAAKVKRIRRDGRVRLAPSNVRGRPLGPPIEGTARVLDRGEWDRAEGAIAANYGVGRRLYMPLLGEPMDGRAYIEITPTGP